MSEKFYMKVEENDQTFATVIKEDDQAIHTKTQDAILIHGKDGASAYEVAVGNGFEGTEEEWLESLVGPKGEKGETGAQGPKGDTGAQGPRGEQGEKGEKGATGDRGPQGIQGLTGAAGAAGPAGERGPSGDKGDPGPQGPQGIQGPAGAAGPQGERGPQGEQGVSGVYVGSGEMPAGYNVQIDPNGEDATASLVAAVIAALPVYGGETE